MATATELIRELEANRTLGTEGQVRAFDQALEELANARLGQSEVDALFLVLDDATENEEVMFGLLHFLEAVVKPYETALIRVAPRLRVRASNWADVLHTRVLNEPASATQYVAGLKWASGQSRSAAATILKAIAAEEAGERSTRAKEALTALK
jgi:hypothetical protein